MGCDEAGATRRKGLGRMEDLWHKLHQPRIKADAAVCLLVKNGHDLHKRGLCISETRLSRGWAVARETFDPVDMRCCSWRLMALDRLEIGSNHTRYSTLDMDG